MVLFVLFAVSVYLMITGGWGVLIGCLSMSIGLFPDDAGNWEFNFGAMLGWWAIVGGLYLFFTA